MTTAKFHGTIYLSARMFTEQQFGSDAVGRVLEELSCSRTQSYHEFLCTWQ